MATIETVLESLCQYAPATLEKALLERNDAQVNAIIRVFVNVATRKSSATPPASVDGDGSNLDNDDDDDDDHTTESTTGSNSDESETSDCGAENDVPADEPEAASCNINIDAELTKMNRRLLKHKKALDSAVLEGFTTNNTAIRASHLGQSTKLVQILARWSCTTDYTAQANDDKPGLREHPVQWMCDPSHGPTATYPGRPIHTFAKDQTDNKLDQHRFDQAIKCGLKDAALNKIADEKRQIKISYGLALGAVSIYRSSLCDLVMLQDAANDEESLRKALEEHNRSTEKVFASYHGKVITNQM